MLCGCLHSAVGSFGGVEITKENVVCGICNEEVSTRVLRRKIMKGRLDLRCQLCDERVPITDLLPGALCTSDNADAASDNYKLLCEWMQTPEKAKSEDMFFPGQKMAWRQLVSTYLSSFLPVTMRPSDSPPLLWLPQLSPTGWVSCACVMCLYVCLFYTRYFILKCVECNCESPPHSSPLRHIIPNVGSASAWLRCRKPPATPGGTPPRTRELRLAR